MQQLWKNLTSIMLSGEKEHKSEQHLKESEKNQSNPER